MKKLGSQKMKKIVLSTVIYFLHLPTLLQACNGQSTPSLPRLPFIDMNSLGSTDSQVKEGFNALNEFVKNMNEHGQKIYNALQKLGGNYASNFASAFKDLTAVISSGNVDSASSRAKMLSAAKEALESLQATFNAADEAGLPINEVPYVAAMRRKIDITIIAINVAIAGLNVASVFGA